MAFKLRGNIFNNNTGSSLLRSNKAGSPFLNSNKCLEYGIVNGKSECVRRVSKKTFADDQGLSYQEVYNKLPTNEAGDRVNPKTGTVYTDVSQFEAEAKKSRETVETRDITSGETTTFDKDLYDQLLSHKKRGDIDGWKKYLSDRNIDMDGKPFKKFIKKAKITRNNEIVRKRREKNKKKNLPTKAEWCAKYPQNCIKGEPKEEFKRKKKQKPKKKTITTTTTTPDTISGWEVQN